LSDDFTTCNLAALSDAHDSVCDLLEAARELPESLLEKGDIEGLKLCLQHIATLENERDLLRDLGLFNLWRGTLEDRIRRIVNNDIKFGIDYFQRFRDS